MIEVWNSKDKCTMPARCRHCKFFIWNWRRSYCGICQLHSDSGYLSNAAFACSYFEVKYSHYVIPSDNVQLNLFDNEKSV